MGPIDGLERNSVEELVRKYWSGQEEIKVWVWVNIRSNGSEERDADFQIYPPG